MRYTLFSLSALGLVLLGTSSLHGELTEAEQLYRRLQKTGHHKMELYAKRWLSLVALQDWTDTTGKFHVKAKYISHEENLESVTLQVAKGKGKDRVEREITVPVARLSQQAQSRVQRIARFKPKLLEELEAAEQAALEKKDSEEFRPGANPKFREEGRPAQPPVPGQRPGDDRNPALRQPAARVPPRPGQHSLKNSIRMEMKLISPGKFLMGSEVKTKRPGTTTPVHEVTLTKPFYLGVYEVTQEQFERVMGMNPSSVKDPTNAVENVSWSDAIDFCKKLSVMPEERSAGRVYRLPTEAEWEYACRAGTTTEYCSGDDASKLGEYAWFIGNSGDSVIDFQNLGPFEKIQALGDNNNRVHPVGTKKPNGWGLYDMHGNMWEWCQDHYAKYTAGVVTDPINPAPGTVSEGSGNPIDRILNAGRVVRGGGWRVDAADCRSAYRNSNDPSLRGPVNGFRVALSSSGQPTESPREPGVVQGAENPYGGTQWIGRDQLVTDPRFRNDQQLEFNTPGQPGQSRTQLPPPGEPNLVDGSPWRTSYPELLRRIKVIESDGQSPKIDLTELGLFGQQIEGTWTLMESLANHDVETMLARTSEVLPEGVVDEAIWEASLVEPPKYPGGIVLLDLPSPPEPVRFQFFADDKFEMGNWDHFKPGDRVRLIARLGTMAKRPTINFRIRLPNQVQTMPPGPPGLPRQPRPQPPFPRQPNHNLAGPPSGEAEPALPQAAPGTTGP